MVSVIIPCYNSAAHIGRAIDSVLKQTLTDWELIIVNNNSIDNITEVVERYQALYPGKILFLNETKKGAAAARNKGIGAVKGDWLQFLDADDELLPEKFEQHYTIAQTGTCEIIAGSFVKENIDNGVVSYTNTIPYAADIWKALISTKLGITSANFWKTDAVVAVGGWDESLSSSQDYDLLFRMMQNNSRVYIDNKLLVNVFKIENSVSRGNNVKRFQEIALNWLHLRVKVKEYLKTNNLFSKEMSAFFDRKVYMMMKWYGNSTGQKFINNLEEMKSLQVPISVKIKSNSKIKYILGLLKNA